MQFDDVAITIFVFWLSLIGMKFIMAALCVTSQRVYLITVEFVAGNLFVVEFITVYFITMDFIVADFIMARIVELIATKFIAAQVIKSHRQDLLPPMI